MIGFRMTLPVPPDNTVNGSAMFQLAPFTKPVAGINNAMWGSGYGYINSNQAQFFGYNVNTAFTTITGSGNHALSGWILYKKA